MFFLLLLLFTLVPLVELSLLIQVGKVIGGWNTIGIVLVTGVLGAALAKSQGRQIFQKARQDLERGGVPAESLIHGVFVFVGGILLITPGILTDIVGLLFVMPFSRWIFIRWAKKHMENGITSGRFRMYSDGGAHQSPFGGGFRVYTHTSTFSGNRPEARDVVEASAEEIINPGEKPSLNSSD